MKDHPLQNTYDEDEEIQYDDEGNPLPPKKKVRKAEIHILIWICKFKLPVK